MKTYIGTKVLKAKPMTKQEYCDYRGWKVPEDEDPNEPVYLVEYEPDPKSKPNHPDHKGYISMSPKFVFDKAYTEIDGLPCEELDPIELKGPFVSLEDVQKAISSVRYIKLGKKIVVCHITLTNGFEVIGKAGVVDPKNFNMEIGSRVAKENALNEVWGHLGSILQNKLVE